MADELEKQIPAEEKLYSEEVSKALTGHLNSKKVKEEADKLNGTSGGWPYPPTKEMVQLLQEAMTDEWGRMKRKYDAFKVENLELEAKKGKTPSVTATLKYNGEWCGGKSVMLKVGDSVTTIAKSEYGYEAYAAAVWEANDAVLGSKCKVLPAGFGLELPRLWVPKWMKEPKAKIPGPASGKAQEIKEWPPISIAYSHKQALPPQIIDLGVMFAEVTVTVAGEVKITHGGVIDATFDANQQTAQIAKAIGPIGSEFSLDFKSKKGEANAVIGLFSKDCGDLKFSGSLKLGSGGFSVNLGVATVKIQEGDISVSGAFKAKADIRIYPKPRPVEGDPDLEEASVGVLIALGIIMLPIAVRVGASVKIGEFGAGAAAKLADILRQVPQLAH